MTIIYAQRQADVLEAYHIPQGGKQAPIGGMRGVVSEFSRASRRRLMIRMNRMDVSRVRVTFVTLTFASIPTRDDARSAFKRFLMRIRRKYPNTSAVWRLEHQQRGSAHFHILFFRLPYIPQNDLQKVWTECTREKLSIVDIRLVKNKKHAMAYVSKYIAKRTDGESATSLEKAAYQHDGETGRFWGILNAEKLPYGKIRAEWLDVDDDAIRYFWWTTRKMSFGRSGNRIEMTMLFADDALKMLDYLTSLANRRGDDVQNDVRSMIHFRNTMNQ